MVKITDDTRDYILNEIFWRDLIKYNEFFWHQNYFMKKSHIRKTHIFLMKAQEFKSLDFYKNMFEIASLQIYLMYDMTLEQ